MIMTVQTQYEEMASKPVKDLQKDFKKDEIELKKVELNTSRGGQ